MSRRNELTKAAGSKTPPAKRRKKKREKAARKPLPPAPEARATQVSFSDAEISEIEGNGRAAKVAAAIFIYCNFVHAPLILADRLRRMGDPAASPRDFECLCEVDAETARPACKGMRDRCRFAPADGGAPPNIYGRQKARFPLVFCEFRRRVREWLDADEAGRLEIVELLRRSLRGQFERGFRQRPGSDAAGDAGEEPAPADDAGGAGG